MAWFAARRWTVVAAVAGTLVAIGLVGLWQDTMKTISLVLTSTIFSIAIGIPIGILMNRFKRFGGAIQAALDIMQTMPPFVYLIPVVMLLGIGRVPGFIAVVIYAVPPIIRLTDLGIRLVDKEVLEAADAYGCSRWQKLVKVQMPLAMPTIMAGINQTIMMALGMVVIASMIGVQGMGLIGTLGVLGAFVLLVIRGLTVAHRTRDRYGSLLAAGLTSMIGVQGLGLNVLQAIANQYFTQGIFNGFAIVGIAVIFDRMSQAYGRRLQRHRDATHG